MTKPIPNIATPEPNSDNLTKLKNGFLVPALLGENCKTFLIDPMVVKSRDSPVVCCAWCRCVVKFTALATHKGCCFPMLQYNAAKKQATISTDGDVASGNQHVHAVPEPDWYNQSCTDTIPCVPRLIVKEFNKGNITWDGLVSEYNAHVANTTSTLTEKKAVIDAETAARNAVKLADDQQIADLQAQLAVAKANALETQDQEETQDGSNIQDETESLTSTTHSVDMVVEKTTRPKRKTNKSIVSKDFAAVQRKKSSRKSTRNLRK